MLDKVRQTFSPKSLESERDDLQFRLEELAADREDLRLQRGAVLTQISLNPKMGNDREAVEISRKIEAIDVRATEMRARRREIDKLLEPKSEMVETIVRVEMPAALLKVQRDLEAARAERETFRVQAARAADDEREQRRLLGRMREAEETIRVLRIQRAEMMAPYNAQISEALNPIVRAAAKKLLQAATQAREALDTFKQAALVAPASGALASYGVAATIDQRPLFAAESFARLIVQDDAE